MKLYKFEIYVPTKHKEELKEAIFSAGGGNLGHYDSTCWETDGTGQFRPLPNSAPHFGAINQIEKVKETKIEFVCQEKYISKVLTAILEVHPYETPAYSYWEVNY